jgi:iron(III) transport system ATP-binding protein
MPTEEEVSTPRRPGEATAPYLQITSLSKQFGSFTALDQVSFDIARGEFVCLLGPSGCGKTTLLRCIAGLALQSSGQIVQDGRDISQLPPSGRDFGIVFQSYALFPNMTCTQNIAFGMQNQRPVPSGIEARVAELMQLVGLDGHGDKYPAQLSGGQQQRVALARALATSPGLLLLDEPLSALDAKVRVRLRQEIRDLQKRLGITTIMVTHDQEEAQAMADRIVVMHEGRVEQMGSPGDIYSHPASAFVADFIGVMNFVPGVVQGPSGVRCGETLLSCATGAHATGSPVTCGFRPEDVVLRQGAAEGAGLAATLRAIEPLGPFVRLHCAVPALGSTPIRVDLRRNSFADQPLAPGQALALQIDAGAIHLFAAGAGA